MKEKCKVSHLGVKYSTALTPSVEQNLESYQAGRDFAWFRPVLMMEQENKQSHHLRKLPLLTQGAVAD